VIKVLRYSTLGGDSDCPVRNLPAYLWAPLPKNGRCCPGFRIPDTIVIRDGAPLTWYFTAKDGQIKKKGAAKLANRTLMVQALTAHIQAPNQIAVAYLTPQGRSYKIKYIDGQALEDMLLNPGAKALPNGLIQKLMTTSACSQAYPVMRASWRPNCHPDLEMQVYSIVSDKEEPLLSAGFPRADPVPDRMAVRLKTACDNIVSHIQHVSPHQYRVQSMEVVFKNDVDGRIWFMFCTYISTHTVAPMEVRREHPARPVAHNVIRHHKQEAHDSPRDAKPLEPETSHQSTMDRWNQARTSLRKATTVIGTATYMVNDNKDRAVSSRRLAAAARPEPHAPEPGEPHHLPSEPNHSHPQHRGEGDNEDDEDDEEAENEGSGGGGGRASTRKQHPGSSTRRKPHPHPPAHPPGSPWLKAPPTDLTRFHAAPPVPSEESMRELLGPAGMRVGAGGYARRTPAEGARPCARMVSGAVEPAKHGKKKKHQAASEPDSHMSLVKELTPASTSNRNTTSARTVKLANPQEIRIPHNNDPSRIVSARTRTTMDANAADHGIPPIGQEHYVAPCPRVLTMLQSQPSKPRNQRNPTQSGLDQNDSNNSNTNNNLSTGTGRLGYSACTDEPTSFRQATGLTVNAGGRSWMMDRPGEMSIRARAKYGSQSLNGSAGVADASMSSVPNDPLLAGLDFGAVESGIGTASMMGRRGEKHAHLMAEPFPVLPFGDTGSIRPGQYGPAPVPKPKPNPYAGSSLRGSDVASARGAGRRSVPRV